MKPQFFVRRAPHVPHYLGAGSANVKAIYQICNVCLLQLYTNINQFQFHHVMSGYVMFSDVL